jgi:hypothetical protein
LIKYLSTLLHKLFKNYALKLHSLVKINKLFWLIKEEFA